VGLFIASGGGGGGDVEGVFVITGWASNYSMKEFNWVLIVVAGGI